MEIIIKQKIPSTKTIADVDGKNQQVSILSVYFDVLTLDTAYVDNDDIGYFPIEIVADMSTPDADVISACEKWITDNDVLSKYSGNLRVIPTTAEELEAELNAKIAEKIAIKYPLPAEMALLWKVQEGIFTMESPEIVALRAWVAEAKAMYPKP